MGAERICLIRAKYFCLAAVLLILAGCGGGSTNLVDARPIALPTAEPTRVSADWLRQQPGQRFGEFSFHLLTADGRALAQWPGVTISENSADDAVTTE